MKIKTLCPVNQQVKSDLLDKKRLNKNTQHKIQQIK